MMTRRTLLGALGCAAVAHNQTNATQKPVTYERLVNALSEPHNWLTYWGDYSAGRHRELKQITTANVKDLRVDWIFQTGQTGAFQTTPLVVDGVMYFTAGNGNAFAVDARSGRQLWRYRYVLAPDIQLCCGTINRGLGMLGNQLFMVTPDAHVVSLDARTGEEVWKIAMADYRQGYGATMAPLVVKDKVITGVAGGEYGIRGFVDAYYAETGKHAWRFYTVPEKGQPGGDTWLADSWKRGGGATWMTGTYEPSTSTLFWGVGNPGADLYGGDRLGDNLYTNSLIALDADSGKLKWHFQFTPHDTHDWDACETPVLLDLPWKGQPRKLVVQANRDGFYYVLDRTTGEFLHASEISRQTWNDGFDAKGRPKVRPNTDPSPEGTRVCPGLAGGPNWMAPSYSPQTGLYYVPVREGCDVFFSSPTEYVAGKPYWGGMFRGVTDEPEYGLLKAINPLNGETKWSFRMNRAPWAGTLSTAGGLLFAGDEDGYLMAFNAADGKLLWKMNTGNRLVTSPITYQVEGKQYIAMPSGAALLTFSVPEAGRGA